MTSVVLKKRTTYKNGGVSYSREGIRASVYCGPKNFDGQAPEELTISASNLAVKAVPAPAPVAVK